MMVQRNACKTNADVPLPRREYLICVCRVNNIAQDGIWDRNVCRHMTVGRVRAPEHWLQALHSENTQFQVGTDVGAEVGAGVGVDVGEGVGVEVGTGVGVDVGTGVGEGVGACVVGAGVGLNAKIRSSLRRVGQCFLPSFPCYGLSQLSAHGCSRDKKLPIAGGVCTSV
jgi:hypothetical protein